jgi:hypothetical protein
LGHSSCKTNRITMHASSQESALVGYPSR